MHDLLTNLERYLALVARCWRLPVGPILVVALAAVVGGASSSAQSPESYVRPTSTVSALARGEVKQQYVDQQAVEQPDDEMNADGAADTGDDLVDQDDIFARRKAEMEAEAESEMEDTPPESEAELREPESDLERLFIPSSHEGKLRKASEPHDKDYIAPGVDEGGKALRDTSYPWYDPSSDELRPIKFEEEEKTKPPPRPTEQLTPEASSGAAEIVAWTIIGIVVAVILFFLIKAFFLGDFTAAGAAARRAGAPEPSFDALPVAAVSAKTDLLGEARRLYEAGDFAQAMVYLYSHLLLRLDRGQYIRLGRGKTNRQYLRELSSRPLRDILQPAMWAFEEAFFGRRTLERDRFEDQWRRLDEFHRLVDEAAPA